MEYNTNVYLVRYVDKDGVEQNSKLLEMEVMNVINHLVSEGILTFSIDYLQNTCLSDTSNEYIKDLEEEIEDLKEFRDEIIAERNDLSDRLYFVHYKISCAFDELNEAYDESDY